MARPITLFTGQWADLPLDDLAAQAASCGFDGLELACWGDHFEVDRALAEPDYAAGPARAARAPRPGVLGDRQPPRRPGRLRPDRRAPPGRAAARGVGRRRSRGRAHARRRADEGHRARRRAARRARSSPASPARRSGTSSTRSRPTTGREVERGYEDFAERWGPIIDVFDAEGVRFALEVHPTEIAYDFVTTRKALAAIDRREGFGINLDPSHFIPQFLDPAAFASEFADRIYHVHVKDSQVHARRPALDPRLAPRLRRGRARLDLRLARPRRRRLRGAVPRR